MPHCCVPKCGNSSAKTRGFGLSYHRFPSSIEQRNEWTARIRRDNLKPENSYVCSKHFTKDSFEREWVREWKEKWLPESTFRRRITDTAVPTLFMCTPWRSHSRRTKKQREILYTEVQSSASPSTSIKTITSRSGCEQPAELVTSPIKWSPPKNNPYWNNFQYRISLLTGKPSTELNQAKNTEEQPAADDYCGTDDYWEIIQHLEEETLDLVPSSLDTQQTSPRQRKNACPLRRRPILKIENEVPEIEQFPLLYPYSPEPATDCNDVAIEEHVEEVIANNEELRERDEKEQTNSKKEMGIQCCFDAKMFRSIQIQTNCSCLPALCYVNCGTQTEDLQNGRTLRSRRHKPTL